MPLAFLLEPVQAPALTHRVESLVGVISSKSLTPSLTSESARVLEIWIIALTGTRCLRAEIKKFPWSLGSSGMFVFVWLHFFVLIILSVKMKMSILKFVSKRTVCYSFHFFAHFYLSLQNPHVPVCWLMRKLSSAIWAPTSFLAPQETSWN